VVEVEVEVEVKVEVEVEWRVHSRRDLALLFETPLKNDNTFFFRMLNMLKSISLE
jgi:hypothetical protein